MNTNLVIPPAGLATGVVRMSFVMFVFVMALFVMLFLVMPFLLCFFLVMPFCLGPGPWGPGPMVQGPWGPWGPYFFIHIYISATVPAGHQGSVSKEKTGYQLPVADYQLPVADYLNSFKGPHGASPGKLLIS